MKRQVVLGAAIGLLVLAGAAAPAGCSGSTVPVLGNDNANLGGLDPSACGATGCGSGSLCCAGADEYCTPTCMKVTSCPAYGRPCKVAVDSGGGGDTGAGDTGGGDTGSGTLSWYWTCGDPVCRATDAASSTFPGCPAEGTSCTTKGGTCGAHDSNVHCGAIMVCDDHDPTKGVGGCPISTRKAKDDIAYVDAAELERLHDETLRVRLATYHYKGPYVDPADATTKHLGFIIEDQATSLAVDRMHDRVDLYGYMSMAVATMQVQEKEIATLKRQMDELRTKCDGARTGDRN